MLVGIDSADYFQVKSLIGQGKLPNIGSVADWCFGRLASTIPPNTAPSWTSMLTGTNPGKHGIFYFKDLDTGRTLSSVDVSAPYVWSRLGSAGVRSIVVNVPLTFPVEKINGVMISGLHARKADRRSVFPEELVPLVNREYTFDMWDFDLASSLARDFQRTYKVLLEGDARRATFFCDLLSRQEWRFACIVLTALDRIQHAFWSSKHKERGVELSEYVETAYCEADRLVGKILRATRDVNANFILASDHGFEKKAFTVYPNVALSELNLFKPKRVSRYVERKARYSPIHYSLRLARGDRVGNC